MEKLIIIYLIGILIAYLARIAFNWYVPLEKPLIINSLLSWLSVLLYLVIIIILKIDIWKANCNR